MVQVPEDMDESIRRLTMVMRAALSASSVFTYDNRKNQELVFNYLPSLQKLAIPVSLSTIKKSNSINEGFGSLSVDDREWSAELALFAQLLILCILHKNTELCDKVDTSLTSLFSSIADMSEDLSTAPTLDIIFILVKPGRAPNSEVQLQACKYFLGFSRTSGLAESLALCMKTAATDAHQSAVSFPMLSAQAPHSPNARMNSKQDDDDDDDDDDSTPKKSMSNVYQKMENPARLLRLMTALMEGGNERSANLLNQRADLTIDLTCSTLVSHVENRLKKIGKSNANLNTIGDSEEDGDDGFEASLPITEETKIDKGEAARGILGTDFLEELRKSANKNSVSDNSVDQIADTKFNILLTITEKDSVGAALFNLLVEQLFLLPLNKEQLHSIPLWNFLDKVAVPAMEAACKARKMTEEISEAVSECICFLELILMTFVRLNIYEHTLEDPIKERILNDLVDSVAHLLHNRQRTPEWLEEDFNQAAVECGIEALNKEQFIAVMERTCHEYLDIEKSNILTSEIESAHEDARVCGQ
mmetsp:Transcript_44356/g.56809  ORF Transcript_44356/g.56809 Transcript_44356/m.56809 type:complete len:532 (+) Transcript_44356:1455-3050(+)